MYYVQTSDSRAVRTMDALGCGRILIVDDDKMFGTFVVAALESKGHDVDWAGSIQDALGSMYAGRYDLVIIDLRLPDGSGLQLLRDATDEGLLADSAAIILTGHDDFEQPSDIRVYRKSSDIDRVLDQMADVVAAARSRREYSGRSRAPLHRALAFDNHRGPKGIRLELVLYISTASEKCQRALRTVQRVLEKYNTSQVSFSVRDLSNHPSSGDEDAVVFTPTLVKRGPGPRTWIVGNIDQDDLLVDLLDVSGVDRRMDGIGR
jgi:ActR/RegA family two-component response regulator